MKSAQRLLEYAAKQGVSACFANPGTSEMHLVAALDATPQIRPVLCLFEGVATGAADGFGRMTGNPALTLLHLGPGLGNGLANLHNAYRARTPILSLIGEHATYHRANNPPLASDITALARPVSAWLKTVERPQDLVVDTAAALHAARTLGPAALILPADVAWSDEEPDPVTSAPDASPQGWLGALDQAAAALDARSVLLLGGRKLSARACSAAQRIAEKTGAQVYVETFPTRIERGAGQAPLKRLPYLTEMAVGVLAGAETVVLAGAVKPIAFFALPDRPTEIAPPGASIVEFFPPFGDPTEALEALADAVGAAKSHAARAETAAGATDAAARLDPGGFAQAIAALLPENAIVSDESNTLGLYAFDAAAGAAPHDWLTLTGGSIGQGLPLATGAAVACRDRRVVAIEADGSALYTIQSLWTQAREGLDVTNIILNNGAYAILKFEMMRAGINAQTEAAAELFDLRRPGIDFTQLAAGFGVPAQRVTTLAEFSAALRRSFATPGPTLIEAIFP